MFDWFTDAAALTPHGFCLLWDPALLWIDAVSDGVTMLAYFSIPLAILWFVRQRGELPQRWIAGLFVAFIVACGLTHGFGLLTLWVPAYQAEAVAKAVTALLSIVTAGALWPLVPRLLALPLPSQFARTNEDLQCIVEEYRANADQLRDNERALLQAQQALESANVILEQRVADRTAALVRLVDERGKSETRFRLVVEASPSGLVMVNDSGRIEMVNAQTERMFGYSREELLGAPVELLVPSDLRDLHPQLRAGFAADPGSRAMGLTNNLFGQRKDGSRFELEIGLNPIETETGMMVLSAIVDISARVRLEEQLRHAMKMDAIGRVTAGVAHDFNNLLQALNGSLELLHDTVIDNIEASEWAQVALRAAARGAELTGRLLAFSRQQVLTARSVPVRPLLNDVAELVRHLFETKPNENNEIVVLPGPEGLAVFADAGQLEAALLNLAVNARDAMPAGGRLRISAYEAEADPAIVPPGRYTVISVADTGIGMDAATLAQACDPFFTTKGFKGTGLGLSMVQGFARQSGGEAYIISVPGEGTTVELWLPSGNAPTTVALPPSPPEAANGHVLLVDDYPDVLLTAGSFLRRSGFKVTTASSSEAALQHLAAGTQFDAIITDFAMPGINGLDLLTRARAIEPSLPALVITGFYDPGLMLKLNDVAVLRKPFNRSELVNEVLALLRQPAIDV